jgi:hypothetical protein
VPEEGLRVPWPAMKSSCAKPSQSIAAPLAPKYLPNRPSPSCHLQFQLPTSFPAPPELLQPSAVPPVPHRTTPYHHRTSQLTAGASNPPHLDPVFTVHHLPQAIRGQYSRTGAMSASPDPADTSTLFSQPPPRSPRTTTASNPPPSHPQLPCPPPPSSHPRASFRASFQPASPDPRGATAVPQDPQSTNTKRANPCS